MEQPLGLGDGTGAPAAIPAHSSAVVAATSSVTCVIEPDRARLVGVERLAGQHRGGDPARRDPPQDRHGDDRRRHADPHLGERERDRRCTTTRSHDAISPIPPARTAPPTAATVGCAASINRSRTRTIGVESGGPVDRSFRSAPAQNAGPSLVSTMTRTPAVDSIWSSRSPSSATSWRDSALRLGCESSVIVAIPHRHGV